MRSKHPDYLWGVGVFRRRYCMGLARSKNATSGLESDFLTFGYARGPENKIGA
jgi:hypothetical protein